MFDLDDGDINHIHIGIMLDGLEDWECDICQRCFGSRQALHQHQRDTSHFACSCGRTFESRSRLCQHEDHRGHGC
eukprot:UN2786